MAGEWLLEQLNSRGGYQSDYSTVLFGTVLSDSPLKVQLSAKITLTEPFLILGKYVKKHDEDIKIDGQHKTVTVDNSLDTGDHVAMIRLDGGQQFYIFEKIN